MAEQGAERQLVVFDLAGELYGVEIEWRFDNRDNPDLFRDTLRALVSAEELTYSELIAN